MVVVVGVGVERVRVMWRVEEGGMLSMVLVRYT
jgi:hypothetical protein